MKVDCLDSTVDRITNTVTDTRTKLTVLMTGLFVTIATNPVSAQVLDDGGDVSTFLSDLLVDVVEFAPQLLILAGVIYVIIGFISPDSGTQAKFRGKAMQAIGGIVLVFLLIIVGNAVVGYFGGTEIDSPIGMMLPLLW